MSVVMSHIHLSKIGIVIYQATQSVHETCQVCVAGMFAVHNLTRGSGEEVPEISRLGAGGVESGRVLNIMGRVGSDFKTKKTNETR